MLRRAVARGPDGIDEPEVLIEAVLARLLRAGLVDDAAFASAKAGSLARRGKPAGAIAAELRARHGIDVTENAALGTTLASLDPMRQATRWAERKRLGPFRSGDREARRERDIAALARAGFPVVVARAVVDGDGSVPSD